MRNRPSPAFRGTLILAMASLAIFLSGPGQTYGVSVFIDPMLAEFGWSRSLISTTYSIATLLSAIPLIIIGRQIDRVGNRIVLTISALLFGAALIGLSRVNGPAALLVGFAFLRTFGSGVLTLGARTLTAQWFVRKRGRAFSILGLASALSLAVVPRVSEALISWQGWRNTWTIYAVVMLLGLAPAMARFVRSRPEDIGEFPDGVAPGTVTQSSSPQDIFEEDWTLSDAKRTVPFWALLLAGIVPSLVVTGVSFHQISIMTARGIPASLAATTFAVESGATVICTIGAGWLVSRYPIRYTLSAGQFLLLVALAVLLFAHTPALALTYSAIRGASSGLWSVTADVAWVAYFGRRHLGSIRGVTFAAGIAGAAIGPLPLGIAFDSTGSYNPAILAYMLLPAAATLLVLAARPPEKVHPSPS